MPDIETFNFKHQELIELLIKASGVHEGEWMLLVNFALNAGNFGPDENQIFPGAIVGVSQVGITRAKIDSPKALVVDAAKVNPKSPT